MTRTKKLLLLAVAFVLVSQIPFAYRRYKLGRLSAVIQAVNSERRTSETKDGYVEYRGVIHVHSFLGGHSEGTFQEIISAAKTNELQFVVMTEHVESLIDTSAMTLKGIHSGVLFVNGNEVKSTNGDRLLVIPGDVSLDGSDKLTADQIAANARSRGALSVIAYPNEFKSIDNSYDGIEVYNVFTNAKRINLLVAFFDALWSHYTYPDLLFGNYYQRPGEELRKWDELLKQGRFVATAGNDSHSNIGLNLGDSSGNRLLGFKLDPYETSFHIVRVHVLVPSGKPLEATTLLQAIKAGHCFIGFDVFGDSSGFRFETSNASAIQGDEVSFQKDLRLRVNSPVSSRLLLFRNGEIVLDETGITAKEIPVVDKGVYRVEAYLPQLGKPVGEQPWIISNPIYVK
ncbi:MAG TPA: hypothetical protein VJ372_01780 [Pyrinomonadaceae bacterium]|jgi:hypothetical protein|nr:hypothetical protein [Pyrinomonadaceae bacterium]